MPQLDTATLANIGQGGADIGGSMAKAYQLKDLIDTTQLRQMDMKRQQQEAAEAGQIKTLASQFDLSTPEGQNKFAAEVAKFNPRQSIAFQREFQDTRHGQNQLIEDDYKLQSMKLDMVENMIAPLAIASMQKKAAGQSPQEIDAAMLPQIMQTVEQARKMTLPSGKPAMGEEDLKMISQMVQAGNFGDTLPVLLQRTKAGREQIQQLFQQQSIGQKVETVKGDPSKFPGTNSNKYYKVEFSPNGKGIVLGEAQPTAAMVNLQQGGGSSINPNAAGTNASQVMAAMTDIGASFPPGLRSSKVQRETVQGLLKQHPDENAQQIAQRIKSGGLSMSYERTASNVVARREGAAAPAIDALNREGGLYDQLLETAKKVDFGSAKFKNSYNLWQQGKVVADPDISEYINVLADTRAEFASVLSRGGQVTDSVRTAAEHAFPNNMSFNELQRNVDRSKKVAAAIQSGNVAVRDQLIGGEPLAKVARQAQVAPPPPAGAPAAPPSSQSPAGAGAASSIKETASEAEYAALPAGSWYRKPGDSPGTHRVKQ